MIGQKGKIYNNLSKRVNKFANILKQPLLDLAPCIRRYLKSGGHAIISGILDLQAIEIIEAYRQNDLEVQDRIDIGEWVTLTLVSSK